LRHQRQGRQSQGQDRPRRQPIRGTALARVSESAAQDLVRRRAVQAGGRKMGYQPFPTPTGAVSRAYTNEYGATINACVYCGYCQFFGCEMGAKASPQTAVLPNLMKQKNFELRTHANVARVNLDAAGTRAIGVTYVDSRGREFEQPAEMVLLCSYVLNNVRLMLLSGIGKPYDPAANTGVVGRNY